MPGTQRSASWIFWANAWPARPASARTEAQRLMRCSLVWITSTSAAGGTHEDFDEYDRVMAAERRAAVLVRPTRSRAAPTALMGVAENAHG